VPSGTMPDAPSQGLVVAVAGANSAQAMTIASALAQEADVSFLQEVRSPAIIEAVQKTGASLVLLVSAEADDLLLSTCGEVVAATQLPVVVFAESAPPDTAGQFVRRGASSFIVKGLSADRIMPIIETAMERHRLMSALQSELINSRNELSARKSIERAKGILMKQQSLSEAEAYDSMRRAAMARGLKLAEVAETIIALSGVAGEPRQAGG